MSETKPIKMQLSSQDIIDAFRRKYIKVYGKMDDRAYFIVGILLATFEDLINPPLQVEKLQHG